MRKALDAVADGMRMYAIVAASSLRSRAAYRWNFILSLFFQMLMYTGDVAALLLIVGKVRGIGGWGTYDILFLSGLVFASSGVYRVLGSELHDFDKYLVNGEFDGVLIRPAHTLLTVAARSIDVEQGGAFLQGVVLMVVAWRHLAPDLGLGVTDALCAALAVACGAAIWFAVVTATAALGFWTTRIDDLQPVLLYGPETAVSYPLSIYPRAVRWIFQTILPVAFGSYVPAAAILRKGPPLSDLGWCAAVAAASFVAAVGLWNLGVRRYTSTGS